MAAGVRAARANLVTVMDALVADTRYDGTTGWRHDPVHDPLDLVDRGDPTRRYCVHVTGGDKGEGAMGSYASPQDEYVEDELTVAYRVGDSAEDVDQVAAEDASRIRQGLIAPAGYDQVATGIYLREVGSWTVDREGTESGGCLLLTISVRTTYRPSFAG